MIHIPMDKVIFLMLGKLESDLFLMNFMHIILNWISSNVPPRKKVGFEVQGNKALIRDLVNNLSFTLTEDQLKALSEIIDDIEFGD